MAIDFPNSPVTDQTYSVGSKTWKYDGEKWLILADPAYALLASPTFTGTPTLPTGTIAITQSPGSNTTAIATTAFVTAAAIAAIANLDNVGDVTITSASSGQVLQWNGSGWINATVSSDIMINSMNAALLVMDIGA